MDMKYFDHEHLPERLQVVSKPIGDLARQMVQNLPDNTEREVGLRKLLEAKYALLRSALDVVS